MLLCPPRMKIIGLVSPEPCPLVRLISCDLFAPGSLKSGTLNFWKMEGAQKVTFSIQNLYSQMHFRSQMCPGGHLEGFEGCLKRRSEFHTRARILCFSKENQRFARQSLQNEWFFKGRSTIWTIILRKWLIFQRQIKDFNDTVKKIIDFSCENQRFQRSR